MTDEPQLIRWMTIVIAVTSLSAVPGCSKSVETQTNDLARYASTHPVGRFPNVWLEQQEPNGQWDKVALVFGWVENDKSCADMKAALGASGTDTYRCVPVRGRE